MLNYNWSFSISMGKECWLIVVIFAVFVSSLCQVVLKKSADTYSGGLLKSVFNVKVLLSYSAFFLCIMVNIAAVKNGLKLSDLPFLESLGYIFVPAISYFTLNEKLSFRKVISILTIMSGVILSQY